MSPTKQTRRIDIWMSFIFVVAHLKSWKYTWIEASHCSLVEFISSPFWYFRKSLEIFKTTFLKWTKITKYTPRCDPICCSPPCFELFGKNSNKITTYFIFIAKSMKGTAGWKFLNHLKRSMCSPYSPFNPTYPLSGLKWWVGTWKDIFV